jgi:Ser/Thr protein kinase RdoA (MazF antagonist)
MGCQFLKMGLNDTYLLRSQSDRVIMRVYRIGWRTLEDIRYELEALIHLDRKGVPVSVPIRSKAGQYLQELLAPEGMRYAALFSFAQGDVDDREEKTAESFGEAAATIHAASTDFEADHQRFALDLEHLIDIPLRSVLPFLSHRAPDQQYISQLCERLTSAMELLSKRDLDVGFCHGDLHGGNAHINESGTVTFFDFDCCGSGWRAYDLAVYRWSALWSQTEPLRWPAFLRGYKTVREISDLDLAAVSLFVLIRHVWYLGLNTEGAVGWIDDKFWDRNLEFIRECEAECIAGGLLS